MSSMPTATAGSKPPLVPQPRLHAKGAVVIDRIVRLKMLQSGIAEGGLPARAGPESRNCNAGCFSESWRRRTIPRPAPCARWAWRSLRGCRTGWWDRRLPAPERGWPAAGRRGRRFRQARFGSAAFRPARRAAAVPLPGNGARSFTCLTFVSPVRGFLAFRLSNCKENLFPSPLPRPYARPPACRTWELPKCHTGKIACAKRRGRGCPWPFFRAVSCWRRSAGWPRQALARRRSTGRRSLLMLQQLSVAHGGGGLGGCWAVRTMAWWTPPSQLPQSQTLQPQNFAVNVQLAAVAAGADHVGARRRQAEAVRL